MNRRFRFNDLKEKGIVNTRTTLRKWIKAGIFPPGKMTGPNMRTWGEDEVQDYLNSRPIKHPNPSTPPRRTQTTDSPEAA